MGMKSNFIELQTTNKNKKALKLWEGLVKCSIHTANVLVIMPKKLMHFRSGIDVIIYWHTFIDRIVLGLNAVYLICTTYNGHC